MSLATELRDVIDPHGPDGEDWDVLDTWDAFVQVSAPLRALLTRETGWYHHDEAGNTTGDPATTPDQYKYAWWPGDDSFALARYRAGELISIGVYHREGSTVLRNTIRLGRMLPNLRLRRAFWKCGVRRIVAKVKDQSTLDKLARAYQRKGLPMTMTRRQYHTDVEWTLTEPSAEETPYDYS